jgi:Uma2 family endonuclease
MATVQMMVAPPVERILLPDVSWETYETLLREFDGRPIRLTYDRGALEIMTLSHGHENYAELLNLFILVLTGELRLPRHSGGSTTFKQEAKRRGLEPDKCYWIKNEPAMRGKKNFDIDTDPPPDLAIEVDITRSSIDRLAIYADLGVKEVWRFDGEALRIYRLEASGSYETCEHSPTFPEVPLAGVLSFLQQSNSQDETSLEYALRDWAREQVLPARQRRKTKRSSAEKRRRPKK